MKYDKHNAKCASCSSWWQAAVSQYMVSLTSLNSFKCGHIIVSRHSCAYRLCRVSRMRHRRFHCFSLLYLWMQNPWCFQIYKFTFLCRHKIASYGCIWKKQSKLLPFWNWWDFGQMKCMNCSEHIRLIVVLVQPCTIYLTQVDEMWSNYMGKWANSSHFIYWYWTIR